MKKIFSYDKYKFNMYDVNSSIIYSDEKIKNRIISSLPLDDFNYIDMNITRFNIPVKKYLEINEFKMKYIPYFQLENILNKVLSLLDLSDIIYLKVVTSIVNNQSIIIFDDVLSYLSDDQKKRIISYLNANNITFINVTSNVEEVLYGKYLIVLTPAGVAIEGGTSSVLSEEKVLKRLGFNLPFVFDLSLQLKSYGVVDKTYLSVDRLVDDLWK